MLDTEAWSSDPGAWIVSVVPILLWVLGVVCAAVAIARGPHPVSRGFIIDRLLRYLFLFPFGVQGLWAFLCQVFLPEQTANTIGWEPSPFQFEVGLANLGLALASFYAAFSGFGARAAVAIAAGCFLGGAGFGHMMDIAQGDNLAPGNAGPILYTDFLTPIVVLALLLLTPRPIEEKPVARSETPAAPDPTQPAQSRLEDELETARKAMRDSLNAGPRHELLPPLKTEAGARTNKSRRHPKHVPEAQD